MLAEVLIGQRMPMVLLLFSLCLTGLVVRRFRWPIAIALVAILAAIAATPVLSPVTYATLVLVFFDRMRDFWNTPYAWLFERAIVMIQAHPWLGLGFDGFRDNCMDPRYLKAVAWLPVTDIDNPEGCSIHPHNYWLQIATSDGLAGVLLFAALSVTWLVRIGSRLLSGARPIQVALFVTLCTMLWPITSTTSLFTLPNAGWVFLTIGWGLARDMVTRTPGTPRPLHCPLEGMLVRPMRIAIFGKRLDRYIFRQLLFALIAVTSGLTALIWLTQSLRFVELVVNHGLSFGVFLRLTGLLIPSFVAVILPITTFVVVQFVYQRLAGDRELTVMRAAGLSPFALARPAFAWRCWPRWPATRSTSGWCRQAWRRSASSSGRSAIASPPSWCRKACSPRSRTA